VIVGGGDFSSASFGQQNATIYPKGGQIRGLTITNPNPKGTGIWIEGTNPILVVGNTFTNSGREGIFVSGTAKPVIADNSFIKNQGSGISFGRNAKGEVRRNLFQQTGYGIALSDRTAPLIIDNQFRRNFGGIFTTRQAMPVLRRNLIEASGSTGLTVQESSQPDLGNAQEPGENLFRDNHQADIQNNSNQALISGGNQVNSTKIRGNVQLVAMEVAAYVGILPFSDIDNHWAMDFIRALTQRRVISGFPDGSFRPDDYLNRAQYAALIAKGFECPPRRSLIQFRDLVPNFWATGAIAKASQAGFLSGFPDGTFRPDQYLTKVQAVVSLVNGLGLQGGYPEEISIYSDRSEIPSYATNAIATATKLGLIANYPHPNQLEPMRPASRAEVTILIYNCLAIQGKVPQINSPYLVNAGALP
jgi:parallel beta-helix repeat protein